MPPDRALILGAGVQGACAALALADRGYAVTLVDEAPDCLLRASLVNEGKIHLGHVYANDPTFETPRLMLRAALSFAPIVDRLVGSNLQWSELTSVPFVYLIASDSQLSVEELIDHYDRLDREYQMLRREYPAGYLGGLPGTLWRLTSIPPAVDPRQVAAAVATPETSIDTTAFRAFLGRAMRNTPNIDLLFQHRVEGVARTPSGFQVEGRSAGDAAWTRSADIVVNCLWSGRLRIDEQMGQLPQRRWVHRLKYRVLADLPDDLASTLPSLTIALGKYGDIVTRAGRRSAYLSWYPVCLRGWATSVDIPDAWRGPTDSRVDPDVAAEVARDTLDAFDTIVPGIRRATITDVRAGVIFSWGKTDIDDPASELHKRDEIGVQGDNGYYSINTGKLTCAPLFSERLLAALN
jgi:glycine/D-amino acid oxidase-like deaminating enzyme